MKLVIYKNQVSIIKGLKAKLSPFKKLVIGNKVMIMCGNDTFIIL